MRFLGGAEGEGFEPSRDGTAPNGFRDFFYFAQPCALRPGARHNARQFTPRGLEPTDRIGTMWAFSPGENQAGDGPEGPTRRVLPSPEAACRASSSRTRRTRGDCRLGSSTCRVRRNRRSIDAQLEMKHRGGSSTTDFCLSDGQRQTRGRSRSPVLANPLWSPSIPRLRGGA